MNKVFLEIVGQLLNDAGTVATIVGRFLWAVARKVCSIFCRTVLLGVPIIIVAMLSLIVVWFAVGCAPVAYMGYKSATETETKPVNETERLLINMNKLGCQIGLYEEELAAYREKRTVGCIPNERR